MDIEKAIEGGVPIRLQGVSSDAYHGGPGVSRSQLDILRDHPPAVFKERQANPPEPTDAMRFGTLVHTAVLEPHQLDVEYISAPKVDRRTKQGKADWAEFVEASEGKQIVTQEDLDLAQWMSDSVHEHPLGRILLDDGSAEDSYWWIDPFTSLLCKCRPDWTNDTHNVVVDIKTARDASPDGFAKAVANGYYLCDAMTRAGMAAAGRPVDDYLFFFIEKTPPYMAAVYNMTPTDRSFGEDMLERLLERYQRCLINDYWPGYDISIQTVPMPRWGYKVRSFE